MYVIPNLPKKAKYTFIALCSVNKLNSKHFFFSSRISNTFQHVNVGCVVIFTFIIQEYDFCHGRCDEKYMLEEPD